MGHEVAQHGRLGPVDQPAVLDQPADDRVSHRGSHRGELRQRPVAVLAPIEVDLGDPRAPAAPPRVDQEPDVHPVAGGEGQGLQQVSPRGDLTRERLTYRGQLGIEGCEQRAGR